AEIIQYWGYPSEEYQIRTDDAYYLQLNRIPHGKYCPQNEGIVLLVHGFPLEGRSWIANIPSNSLGFFLADAGYDVWIINNRGTTWSRRHQEFSIDQQEFWEFSFHEMAIYDIPAAINFILQKTGQDSLYYIGYSQGASLGFITFGILPYLSDRVKLYIALNPPYTLEDTAGLLDILSKIPRELRELIWGTKELCFVSKRLKTMLAYACSYPVIDKLCVLFASFSGVINVKNLNIAINFLRTLTAKAKPSDNTAKSYPSRMDVYAATNPDYSSVKTLTHWIQTTPPFYKIEDVTVPVAVWSGEKDTIVTKKNTESLLAHITHLVFYKDIPDWTHSDPVVGLDAPRRLYPDVLELMQKYKD
ncbi:lipase member M-like, partial [Notechis scutatus]|uniref:Lipase member M-like n=1 Tax=Notechis scutatus TaxID=8663 RepID=A0A6J1W2X6_9SAUR